MKRYSAAAVLFLSLFCAGCLDSMLFREETSVQNKIRMEMVGSGNKLLAAKKIQMDRRFKMIDGTEIDTWVVNTSNKTSRGTVVILHSAGESKSDYLEIGINISKRGLDVILIDLRHHGRSGGKYITCGAKEKEDVSSIVDTLVIEKVIAAKPIYILGFTFGAATAIQYAAIEDNVSGIVAFAPWKDTVTKTRRDLGLILDERDFKKRLAAAGEKAGFDPQATSAFNDAAKLKCPVYLIHAMGDLVVPVSDSEAIFSRLTGPRELKIIIPGPEQIAIGVDWANWVTKQVDKVIEGNIGSDKTSTEKK